MVENFHKFSTSRTLSKPWNPLTFHKAKFEKSVVALIYLGEIFLTLCLGSLIKDESSTLAKESAILEMHSFDFLSKSLFLNSSTKA